MATRHSDRQDRRPGVQHRFSVLFDHLETRRRAAESRSRLSRIVALGRSSVGSFPREAANRSPDACTDSRHRRAAFEALAAAHHGSGKVHFTRHRGFSSSCLEVCRRCFHKCCVRESVLEQHIGDAHNHLIPAVFVHKPAFANAILHNPKEPLESPYRASVEAVALETGVYLVAVAKSWTNLHPILCPRWWQ